MIIIVASLVSLCAGLFWRIRELNARVSTTQQMSSNREESLMIQANGANDIARERHAIIQDLEEELEMSNRIRGQLEADAQELHNRTPVRECIECRSRPADVCLDCNAPEEMGELRGRAKKLHGLYSPTNNDEALELRLKGSEILRPSTAEDIRDESHSSFETVLLVNNMMRVLGELTKEKAAAMSKEAYVLVRKYDK